MNKDTIVGIVGAVILVVAMVGVFKYESSEAKASLGSTAFDVTWASATVNGPTAQATTALGDSTTETVTIDATNLTDVVFTFKWTAAQGRDTLEVTVTPPAGSGLQANSSTGDSGTISIPFKVGAAPESVRVFGNGESDAEARLAGQHTKTLGSGEWTVEVAFTDATGIENPLGQPVLADEEVTWNLATALKQYVPDLQKVQ